MVLDPAVILPLAGIGEADPWQRTVLRGREHDWLLLCCRQSGKSTVTAGVAVDTLLHQPGALVLIASPTQRQSQELRRKVETILTALGPLAPSLTQRSALSLELATGSRLVCLPGSEVAARSWSAVALLVIDEAARLSDTVYHALRPVLAASQGRTVLLSTPAGRRGFFFEEWTNGAGWHRVQVTAEECPRITAAFLAEERAALPATVFASEYLCSFDTDATNPFGTEFILAALRDDVVPLWSR